MDTLKVEYNMNDMFQGIKEAVKQELTQEFVNRIRAEIKEEMYANLFSEMKTAIETNTNELMKEMMLQIFDEEIVKIGGGWKEEVKEYTMREYVLVTLKERILSGRVKGKTEYNNDSFSDWFQQQCMPDNIKNVIDREIDSVRKSINNKIKSIFDETTKKMLSDAILGLLSEDETYKKICAGITSMTDKV